MAYMMRLLNLVGLKDAARERILTTLPGTEEGWDRDWMVDLLEGFATEGDPVAWNALSDLAASGDERAQDNLATTDDAGLRWVAEHVLPTLAEDDRWRVGSWLPDEESDDVTPTQKRLRLIYERLLEGAAAKRKRGARRGPKARNYLRSLGRDANPYIEAQDFARTATPRQWRAAAARFLRERRRKPLRSLASLYRHRSWPLSVGLLFRQVTHPVRGPFVVRILGTIDTPEVRRFALGLLRRRPLAWRSLDSIEASLRPGDEPLILAALRSVEGQNRGAVHNPVLDVVALFREHPDLRWQPHAEWILEHSPCSMCRGSALDWLVEHGRVPQWFVDEAIFDAEPDVCKSIAALASTP